MWVKLFFLTIGLFFSKDGLNKIDNSDFSDISDSSDPEHGFIPSSDPLNVHLLVTSHMDAGWVHTFEEYYKGVQGYSGECVKCILDNVMKSFSINPERKYDMAEVAFFNKWWADQTPENRAAFKEFAKKNQFRFVNGGWVTNDEATAYYDDIMENFILGHRWLKDNLDMDSNVGWQVDSFGNSAAHAGLMAQAGYDAMFFSRADYRDRDKRKLEKSLQFNWAPPNPHNESIFTQMLYLGYSDSRFVIPESEKCRTIFCKGSLTKSDYTKVEDLVKKQAESFNTKNILLLVCDDFLFSDESEKYYKGAEAMIKHFDKHPSRGIKVKYSHLSEYVNQVIQDISALKPPVEMPIKHDDTYPYIEQRNHIWTGYFTSKSMYKMLVREFSAYYNAAKLLLTKILLLNNKDILDWDNDHSKVNDALNLLEQPLALIQHHDSITGTMKDFVRRDYEDIVLKARTAFEEILQPIMVKYLHNKTDETFTSTNISYNWLYQDDSYYKLFNNDTIPAFTVFNPGNTRSLLIKLKVPTPSYNILNESNILIPIDVICHNQDSNDDCYIYFVDNFIAYSTRAYKVVPIASGEINNLEATDIPNKDTNLYTSDSLSVNVSRNLLDFEYQYCLDQKSCTKDTFTMDYYYYDTSAKNKGVPSGAYLFSANNMEKVPYSAVNSGRIFKGKYLTVLQIFRDDLRTDIKILHHQPERGFEVDTYLLPPKEKGREIVLVVKSDSINNGDSNHTIFYTDSNGYSMQKRTKNHKDGFDIDTTDAISINFYPMTSNMYIESEKTKQRLSIVTDRAQGVASLNTGELEVMIHRVTFRDDNKGVGEALQEKVPNTRELINVTTRHFISYSQVSLNINDQRRQQQYDLDRSPHLWFYISKTPKFEGNLNNEGKELVLPELVKLYVRSYQPDEYIVRLHNLDDNNAKNVELYDVKTNECTLLTQFAGIKGFEVESVKELSWMTTKDKSDLKKNILDPESLDPRFEHNPQYNNVNLVPMEIRTFSIKRKLSLFQNVPDATVE